MYDFSVLIVDDDEVDRYSLKRLLKSLNYNIHITESEDGEEAVTFFKENDLNKPEFSETFPPLIVFLDINMPRMNGFEFLEEFRLFTQNKVGYQTMVFIMVTSSDNLEDRRRAEQFDVVKGYINKMPKTADALLACINKFLPTIQTDTI
jgi:CheY-like chemotaxis protein